MSLARAEEPVVKRCGGRRAIPCFRRVGADPDTVVLAFSQSLLHLALMREVIRFSVRLERRHSLRGRFDSVASRATGMHNVNGQTAASNHCDREKEPGKFACPSHMPVSSFRRPCAGRRTVHVLHPMADRMKIAGARRFRYRAGMRTSSQKRSADEQEVENDASHAVPHFDTF
ncbi:hypothetical protein QFZ94_000106 [Paraburkholderia sp. JPY465]|uniref:hypothetical protein n=1 Tax=Paraburkholderia sp. JPY465 TaxID=3042285 RepID=UPI003D24F7E6